MEKKQYTTPLSEVTDLGALGRLMKELGEASMPVQPAPERKDVF